MFENFKSYFDNTKLILGTLAIVISSIIGAYTFVTDYFVTKAYAKEMERSLTQVVQQVQVQTTQNSLMIIEMKLMEYERRMERGEKLTPTETRQYDRLLLEYNSKVK